MFPCVDQLPVGAPASPATWEEKQICTPMGVVALGGDKERCWPEGWLSIGGMENASPIVMVGKLEVETCPNWQPNSGVISSCEEPPLGYFNFRDSNT
ncbi:hypothetical protein E2C01_006320 [Portunus trituberculatus]|uniref:Uncharacterized protein n=1 Tax=Portunus trituberculatus TaxID=210409 RepID=A0A5B7CUX0_PORTR|nr:hypothetical protein [Portunus trituberculatus]